MHCFAIRTLLLFSLITASSSAQPSSNWPAFRGPSGLGYTTEQNLPLEWGGPANKNVAWKSPLKGQGHASPIVWNDRLFVCTAYWEPDVAREKVIPEHHVAAYSTADGKLLWDTTVPPGPWLRTDFRSGPGGGYASATPATDGNLVYCVFGSSVIAALDFDGKIAWRREIVPHTFDVTIGSSPVLYRDTVLFLCAMAKPEDSKLIAFDKKTGATKWEQPLPNTGFGHSTPLLIDVNGKPQLLVLASGMKTTDQALQSLDPESGKRLWWCRGAGDAASPAYANGLVYFDSGRTGPGTCVDPTGQGDVTATHVKWTTPSPIPESIGSPLIVRDYLYRLHQPAILKCFELKTGKQVYSQRLEGLSTTWASPLADPSGRIFFATAGKSYVIQSGPEFRILATNDLNDPNPASPAVANGSLYLLGSNNLHCIRSQ